MASSKQQNFMKTKYNFIKVNKANVHNLKNVSVSIPKDALTVITGPSGSGKSSLAFDTIYVEGQRRYIESLSSYARQFLGQYDPPDVESIEGLSPAIAIDQKSGNKNPRSTVGTITEIYDYFRILFARVGTLYCPDSGVAIEKWSAQKIFNFIKSHPEGTKIQIFSPQKSYGESFSKAELSKILAQGFSKVLINKEVVFLDDESMKKITKLSSIDIVVDRIALKNDSFKRLVDSIEIALKLGSGDISFLLNEKHYTLSEHYKSPKTGKIFPNLEPNLFSFNSPVGACPECNGLGILKTFDEMKMIGDANASILEGALLPVSKGNSFLLQMLKDIAKAEKVDLKLPFKKLPKSFLNILYKGNDKIYKYTFSSTNAEYNFSKTFPGILLWLDKKYKESQSEKVRLGLEAFMDIKTCPFCQGQRLNTIALSTRIKDKNIMSYCQVSIGECLKLVKEIELDGNSKLIAAKLLKEITSRLNFLNDVGLNYLTLGRAANSLSGGESQRIRLATQIGSALSGVLYVLDEPSIGLHQKDNIKLIDTLKKLRDIGNTLLVVEHDEETILSSDYIIDIGPGAGIHGGEIVYAGEKEGLLKDKNSLTAKFLNNPDYLRPKLPRRSTKDKISIFGAKENNLKSLNLELPLKLFVTLTGVSGSGKSTLVHKVLVPALKAITNKEDDNSDFFQKNYKKITCSTPIDSIIELDQSPIGRTPHSNPATYTGMFDLIRTLFSQTPEAQIRGYGPGRFSFNVKGGRCEACEGNGVKKIEMHFLPDVYITCEECRGSRYNNDTLSVFFKGKNIADILNLSIETALEFFGNHRKLSRILETLNSVGLGYMKLGQPATTVSGGEAQRLKLCRELSKSTKGHTLYVLDEPTTGLHFQDISLLLTALNQLVDKGNSLVVIEHNLDIIKNSDYIVDLGPDGGDAGGSVVTSGTPEEVAKSGVGYTSKYLKKVLRK
jgi:excinuclease ABC subunit A